MDAIRYILDCLQHLATTRSVTFWLFSGAVMLTIGLFVSMRTRWGNSRPVTTCVALSVFAHVLLIAFAWTTEYVMSIPAMNRQEAMSAVSILTEPEPEFDDEEQNTLPEKPPAPWERMSDQNAAHAKPDRLEKPTVIEEIPDAPVAATDRDVEVSATEVSIEKPRSLQRPKLSEPVESELPSPVELASRLPQSETQAPMAATPMVVERRGSPHNYDEAKDDSMTKPEIQMLDRPDPEKFESGFETQAGVVEKTPSDDHSITDDFVAHAINASTEATRRSIKASLAAATKRRDLDSNPTDPFSDNRLRDVIQEHRDVRSAKTTRTRVNGTTLPAPYVKRIEPKRLQIVEASGGSERTEAAVRSALKWLSTVQQPDGSWNPRTTEGGVENYVHGHHRDGAGSRADTGITALALLAYLGAGHTHQQGDYRETVRKGLSYLLQQQRADGCLAGDAKLFARMYCHSMSLFALAEALAISGDERLKAGVERGVAYSLSAQNPTDGGWRYQPGDPGDMSQFGWQVMALQSAQNGGVDVPESSIRLMQKFLQSCAKGNSGGLAAYRPVERASLTMTAESLLCRHLLFGSVDPAIASEATSMLVRSTPSREKVNYYYWYYATMATFRTGGDDWQTWNAALSTTLVETQVQRGDLIGSWPPNGTWSGYGGRVYSTAMATMCLEVYYRYTR